MKSGCFKTKINRKLLDKKNMFAAVMLSISVSFTIFFFSSIEVFLGNQKEFLINFEQAAIPLLIVSLVCFATVLMILILLHKICEKAFEIVLRLILGFLLACYIQSLFFNGKMSSQNGIITYPEDMKTNVINFIFYYFILFIPIIIYAAAHKKSDIKWLNKGNKLIVPYAASLIFLMQLCGTLVTILNTDQNKNKNAYSSYFSYESAMSLSKEENIVVFLFDRLDSLWMDEVIERYPEVKDELEGFTFYQNNIAHNTNTFPSVAQMLTGSYYEGEIWVDFLEKAWKNNTIPHELKNNNYHVNLFIDKTTEFNNYHQLEDICDNIEYCQRSDYNFNYIGKNGIVPVMTRFSFSRTLPYIFKGITTKDIAPGFSNEFISYLPEIDEKLAPVAIEPKSDIKFNNYIKRYGLKSDSSNKTFTFIHLNGAHGQNEIISALYNNGDESQNFDRISTARGAYEIIFEYLRQMKKLDVYDNSTIIIVGDHGRIAFGLDNGMDKLTHAITTGLLIKPARSDSEPLKIDSTSELSNDFFMASILEYAGISHSDYGYSYNDIINQNLHPDRYLQTFQYVTAGEIIYKTLYKITGDARDFDNWEAQAEHE
ncbi:MAG: sulfatase-like hydrolase/transferase [Ruminococcus flavefaciens]|nr:sulfatase-like hydrolase/transferase [Ruminococcus flavefaciens]MCM1059155.1 sulfatase-like hydrolase/transferase [Eubacterium sp.]